MNKYLMCSVIALSLFLIIGLSAAEEAGYGHIKGRIAVEGEESAYGWLIKFFNAVTGPSPFTLEYWRISDFRERTDEFGGFLKELPEGEYYIVALKRSADNSGNPKVGDLIYPRADDIEQKRITVLAGETTDIGVISDAVPFRKEWAAQGRTGIEGRVLDNDGKPLVNESVRVYTKPGMEKPSFAADNKTDDDGKFVLRLPEGGEYYFIVRGYRVPDPVTVKTGEMTGGVKIYPFRD